MAVDIGAEAIGRLTYLGTLEFTAINKANPASFAGIVTSIDIWVRVDLPDCRVGTFYITNGNTLKCRDSEAIGAIVAGSKVTRGVDIAVEIGDYLGFFSTAAKVELDIEAGEGVWYKSGEYIDPNDEATYTFEATWVVSLGGYMASQTYERSAALEVGIAPTADRQCVYHRYGWRP